MVNIWLMMVNIHLVGGFNQPLWDYSNIIGYGYIYIYIWDYGRI